MYRQKQILLLFELESDEEDDLFLSEIFKKRNSTHSSFLNRSTEGIYNRYIKKYCYSDPQMFKKYFRISFDVFSNVLNKIKPDLQSRPYNRHRVPISPEEKFCLTLR